MREPKPTWRSLFAEYAVHLLFAFAAFAAFIAVGEAAVILHMEVAPVPLYKDAGVAAEYEGAAPYLLASALWGALAFLAGRTYRKYGS